MKGFHDHKVLSNDQLIHFVLEFEHGIFALRRIKILYLIHITSKVTIAKFLTQVRTCCTRNFHFPVEVV